MKQQGLLRKDHNIIWHLPFGPNALQGDGRQTRSTTCTTHEPQCVSVRTLQGNSQPPLATTASQKKVVAHLPWEKLSLFG
jgi:hypothetical protein